MMILKNDQNTAFVLRHLAGGLMLLTIGAVMMNGG